MMDITLAWKKQTPTEDIRVVIEYSNERRRVRSTTINGLRGPIFVLSIENMHGRWVGFVAVQNIYRIEKLGEITRGLRAIKRT
jgi:hypothetical protein